MSTVLLSDAPVVSSSLTALSGSLHAELARQGRQDVRSFELSGLHLGNCSCEFECTLASAAHRQPQESERELVQAVRTADEVILLDAVTFGGHSHMVAHALDRLRCLLGPPADDGTRRAARMFSLGWLPAPEPAQTQTWSMVADANALRMGAPLVGTAVVDDGHPVDWPGAIRRMLESHAAPGQDAAPPPLVSPAVVETGGVRPVRRAAFLIGSVKHRGASVSETVARSLGRRLEEEGVNTEYHYALEFTHDGASATAMARVMAQADVFILVTALHADALPAEAVHALERVQRARLDLPSPARFLGVVNGGAQVIDSNSAAARMAHHFASAARYVFAGCLRLGAGTVVSPECRLEDPSGPVSGVVRALDAVAPALAHTESLPADVMVELERTQRAGARLA